MAETLEEEKTVDVVAPELSGPSYRSMSHFLESQSGDIAVLAAAKTEAAAEAINALADLKVEEKLNKIKSMSSEKKAHSELAEYNLMIAIHEINHFECLTSETIDVPKVNFDSTIIVELKAATVQFLFAPENTIKSEFFGRITAALTTAISHLEAL